MLKPENVENYSEWKRNSMFYPFHSETGSGGQANNINNRRPSEWLSSHEVLYYLIDIQNDSLDFPQK